MTEEKTATETAPPTSEVDGWAALGKTEYQRRIAELNKEPWLRSRAVVRRLASGRWGWAVVTDERTILNQQELDPLSGWYPSRPMYHVPKEWPRWGEWRYRGVVSDEFTGTTETRDDAVALARAAKDLYEARFELGDGWESVDG